MSFFFFKQALWTIDGDSARRTNRTTSSTIRPTVTAVPTTLRLKEDQPTTAHVYVISTCLCQHCLGISRKRVKLATLQLGVGQNEGKRELRVETLVCNWWSLCRSTLSCVLNDCLVGGGGNGQGMCRNLFPMQHPKHFQKLHSSSQVASHRKHQSWLRTTGNIWGDHDAW